ncbi:MAG: hypothetical protein ACI8Z1_003756 [Candidatus Azotimanducaceae bacterium]|jgi:hypothetical protein
MNFKWMLFFLVAMVLWGCSRLPDQSSSYRQQLGQLTHMREAGAISEREYLSMRSRVFRLMLH